eukprot:3923024-Pyramimonas_sp.AAC.1
MPLARGPALSAGSPGVASAITEAKPGGGAGGSPCTASARIRSRWLERDVPLAGDPAIAANAPG